MGKKKIKSEAHLMKSLDLSSIIKKNLRSFLEQIWKTRKKLGNNVPPTKIIIENAGFFVFYCSHK